jgi:hypothetical protein
MLQVCVRAEDDQDVVGASKRRVNQVHLTKKSKSQGSLDYGTLLAHGVRGWEAGSRTELAGSQWSGGIVQETLSHSRCGRPGRIPRRLRRVLTACPDHALAQAVPGRCAGHQRKGEAGGR